MNQLQQQLARLEQKLLEREHHARHNLGKLDRTYLDMQARRRELSAAWMEKMTARLRKLERENAALRQAQDKTLRRQVGAEGVVLTERGFKNGG